MRVKLLALAQGELHTDGIVPSLLRWQVHEANEECQCRAHRQSGTDCIFRISTSLKALGINTNPEQGIDLEVLLSALDRWPVKACVLSANASNPLGCTMSDDAKHSLVKMLARHRIAPIEDDAYGDLAVSQQRSRACFSYQQEHPVYYCSSFSKTICPGLRVGWIVSPPGDQQARLSKFLSNIATATIEQVALTTYLRSGA
jgi:DNA-binding transcriptional MocR family regulator